MIIFPRIFAVARYRLNHTLQDNVSFLTTEREEGWGMERGWEKGREMLNLQLTGSVLESTK